MKAAVFHGKHDMRIEEIESRKPGDDEVLINVKVCGICGTDIHIYEGDEGATKVNPPVVLGHEFSGVVYEVGKNVKNVKTEDRVSIDPNDMCGGCYFCRQGQGHFCENFIGTGTSVNGGFEEFVTVHSKQVYRIPSHITFEEAAMTEPISCCLNGIDITQIKPGHTVLVIGGGPIGLIMLQLARYAGAAIIILSEPVEYKRIIGSRLGADIVIDPFNESFADVFANNNIKNIDRVIECVGSGNTMKEAVDLAGKGSIVMFFGLTSPSCEISIKPFEIFKKELSITSSFINPYTFERSLSLLASGRVKVKDIITDVVDLDYINEVFEKSEYRTRGKVVVKIQDHDSGGKP